MSGAAVLRAEGLTKRFGFLPVLKGVDLELRLGELLLLLGPNGAGKTTLTRLLSTLSRPQGGRLFLEGAPLSSGSKVDLRRRIGYLSHQTFIYSHLSAAENLEFFGGLYGVTGLKEKVPVLLGRVGLSAARGRLAGTFSRGMQQRLSLARVLLPGPSILILDEPYTGLDPEGSATLTSVLRSLKGESRALLLVTHDLEACLDVADRVAVLNRGRIVWEADAAGMDLASARKAYFEAVGAGKGSKGDG